ncbi:hypothetical protein [Vannielia sp.]|uniref:hypothetical protein n=1 Tax=Vannielia sp. TaxID=2813045 RepID=UPI0026302410|nr:hypothetical protein [Vannielia sp.]MDF1872641.1 hypothetical protein [Vannielia sp.]
MINFSQMETADWIAIASVIAGLLGIAASNLVGWWSTRKTQRAEVYFNLEMEANRIFEIARERPEMFLYLEGFDQPETEQKIRHELFWFLPQILSLFEIAIIYRQRRIFEVEIFSTWMAWILELSLSERFDEFWQELRLHYRPELRALLQIGLDLSKDKSSNLEETTELFYAAVSDRLKDPAILQYYKSALEELNMADGVDKISVSDYRGLLVSQRGRNEATVQPPSNGAP